MMTHTILGNPSRIFTMLKNSKNAANFFPIFSNPHNDKDKVKEDAQIKMHKAFPLYEGLTGTSKRISPDII